MPFFLLTSDTLESKNITSNQSNDNQHDTTSSKREKSFCLSKLHTNGNSSPAGICRLGRILITTFTFSTLIIIVTMGVGLVESFPVQQSHYCSVITQSTFHPHLERNILCAVSESKTDPPSYSPSSLEDSNSINEGSQRSFTDEPTFIGMEDLIHKNAASLMVHTNGKAQSNGFDVNEKNGKIQPSPISTEPAEPKRPITIEKNRPWKRRHARSIDEGIRNEKLNQNKDGGTSQIPFLSNILESTQKRKKMKRYGARTITGLITALAEEAKGLEVEIDARRDTPISRKHIDSLVINFDRLGFKPLRLGGLNSVVRDKQNKVTVPQDREFTNLLSSSNVTTADEAFKRIDADNSGALDAEELAKALDLAMDTHVDERRSGSSGSSKKVPKQLLTGLASRLVSLYDTNGDKELDLEEYQNMVEDMAVLRRTYVNKAATSDETKKGLGGLLGNMFKKGKSDDETNEGDLPKFYGNEYSNLNQTNSSQEETNFESVIDVSNSNTFLSSMTGEGSIVMTDLKVDLRRILFGAVPLVKKITPGGPLILEPFTMTVSASFNADDIMNSFLLNQGLKLLVARALRRRVRSFRDLVDGAVFYGRTWNMASKSAPIVEIPELTSIEFDSKDRAIISGRARIRSSPDAPFIENGFKCRTKIGTRENGQVIRLKEPELALVLECPKAWERNIVSACKRLNLPIPRRPEPVYAYFPLVSPLKKNDKDGYNMGNDNRLISIDIKDGALRVVMSAVLRPGRFLGNHYVAFTVPNRSVIVTMDRVKDGIRVARRNKRSADEALKAAQEQALADAILNQGEISADSGIVLNDVTKNDRNGNYVESLKFLDADDELAINPLLDPNLRIEGPVENKGFFNKFVQGYITATMSDKNAEERAAKLSSAISEWFGRQELGNGK